MMQAIEHTGGQKKNRNTLLYTCRNGGILTGKSRQTRRMQQNFTTWLLFDTNATTTYVSVEANLALYGYFQCLLSMVMAHCQIQPSCGMSLYSYMYYGLAVA